MPILSGLSVVCCGVKASYGKYEGCFFPCETALTLIVGQFLVYWVRLFAKHNLILECPSQNRRSMK